MREAEEAPAREGLGHGELELHLAVFVGDELREKEGAFVEIFARGDFAEIGGVAACACACAATGAGVAAGAVGLFVARAKLGTVLGEAFAGGVHRSGVHGNGGRHRRGGGGHFHLRLTLGGGLAHHRGHHAGSHLQTAAAAEVAVSPQVHGEIGWEAAVGHLDALHVLPPVAADVLEVLRLVGEGAVAAGMILAEETETIQPAVREEGVERFVVERGGHFGDGLVRAGAGDDRGPSLLLIRLELRGEMLPANVEVLVAPRHVDATRVEVSTVLADLRDVQREAAAHGLGDGVLDAGLRVAGLGPVTLEHFAAMLDLDERAARVIAGAPEREELLARLGGPLGRGDEARNANGETRVVGIEDLQREAGGDFFAEAILRFEQRAIRADAEFEGEREVALLVGGEAAFRDDLAERPGIGIGKVGLGLGATAVCQRRALDLLGLFEAVDFHVALGERGFAIERAGRDAQVGGLGFHEPLGGGERGGEGGVADIDRAVGGARLAARIGDIRVDAEDEGRLVFLRNRQIGLGWELDDEGAVVLGRGGAAGDFLARGVARRTPVKPAPPHGPAHVADDAVFHLRAVDGRAGVARGGAGERDGFIELRGGFGCGEGDLEFRAFVFLDLHARGAVGAVLHEEPHRAHEAVARRGEAAGERAVVVAARFLAGDFLAVGIGENHGKRLAGEGLVIVTLLIDGEADALVLHELAGPVERAVGEENGLRVWTRRATRIRVDVLRRADLTALMHGLEEIAATGLCGEGEEAVGVGGELRRGDAIALVGELPREDVGIFHGFARVGFEDEAFDLAVARAHDKGEVADPDVGVADHVVGIAELGIVARYEEIETRLELRGRGELLGALLVIGGGGELGGPFERGLFGEEFLALVVVQIFWTAVAALEEDIPIVGNGAEIHGGDVAVVDGNLRPRRVPDALGIDLGGLGFDAGDEVLALLAANALGENFRAT